MAPPQGFERGPAHVAGPLSVENAGADDSEPDVTLERVLQELGRLAFASIRDVVDWNETGIKVKPSSELHPDQVAAIAEIVASAKDNTIYRVKMHDKNPPLGLLVRYFVMSKPAGEAEDDGEDPREFLVRERARLRARRLGRGGDQGDAGAEGTEAPAPLALPGTR